MKNSPANSKQKLLEQIYSFTFKVINSFEAELNYDDNLTDEKKVSITNCLHKLVSLLVILDKISQPSQNLALNDEDKNIIDRFLKNMQIKEDLGGV